MDINTGGPLMSARFSEYLVRHSADAEEHIGTVVSPCPSGDPDYCVVEWWGRNLRGRYHWSDLVTIQEGLFGNDDA
jgi:hypothetical protein